MNVVLKLSIHVGLPNITLFECACALHTSHDRFVVVVNDAVMDAFAKHWPKLQILRIDGAQRFDVNVSEESLTRFVKGCTQLKELMLGAFVNVTDHFIRQLPQACPRLQVFSLWDNALVTPEALTQLIRKCELSDLCLINCKNITEDFLRPIGHFGQWGDVFWKYLIPLESGKTLRYDVGSCSGHLYYHSEHGPAPSPSESDDDESEESEESVDESE